MKQWSAIIVDDQQASIDHLILIMKEIEYIKVERTFTDPMKALRYLRINEVHLIILDVELGSMDAFDFLSSMPRSDAKVVFYSAHAQFEDPGYERNVVDFLLKPVSPLRLKRSMQRINEQLNLQLPDLGLPKTLDHYDHFFQVKGHTKFMRTRVEFKNIIYITKSGRHLLIYQNDGLIPAVSRESFDYVLSLLPANFFIRCAQSTVFNVMYFHSYVDQSIKLNLIKEPIHAGKLSVYKDLRNFLETNKI
ncbi:LytTR family DNA-binding domain-containing protein [Sphingobacterium sp.]|uniref:LytR/AlgR family response regulator transcription factor n=1 Tax=Sphingobacterium sp. TaxID=341027 RepID=UPI0028972BED|nr:LytTR family DNA-binding domain-containing protein [Sphingobacterium sp.]